MANVRRLLLAPTVSPCGVAHSLFLELFRIKWLLTQLKAFEVLANAAHRLIGNKKEHKTKTKSEKRTEQSDLPTQEARSFVIDVCWRGSSVGRGPRVSRSKGHKIFE